MNDTVSLHKPPHMRGIKQAIEELKQLDPNTALTEKALRRLVLTGAIPSVRIGTKYLINMDLLNNYLYNGSCGGKEVSAAGGIRKIAE
ncbi:MAG: hypothetical protein ACI4A5_08600 [Hominilimicola sp.]